MKLGDRSIRGRGARTLAKLPCVVAGFVALVCGSREASAHARTITLIGSNAGLSGLHVIYLSGGRAVDVAQPTTGTQWLHTAVPVGAAPAFTAIKAVPGVSPAAVELIALEANGHLWSTTMAANGTWYPYGFTRIGGSNSSGWGGQFSAFDAVNGMIYGVTPTGGSGELTESSSQAWSLPGWTGGGSFTYPGKIMVKQSNGRIGPQPTTVTVEGPPSFSGGPTFLQWTMPMGPDRDRTLSTMLAGLSGGAQTISPATAYPGWPSVGGTPESLVNVNGSWSQWVTAPSPSGLTFQDIALGYGNNGTLQMVLLGQDGHPYLAYMARNGGASSGAWTWFGALPDENNQTFKDLTMSYGNGYPGALTTTLQLVGLSGQGGAISPTLIWQDPGGNWHWFGSLPNKLGTASAADLDMGHATASTLQVGYYDQLGRVFVSNQDSGGNWTALGPL